ncbi:MAG: SIS domain-containing protein [bacterium]
MTNMKKIRDVLERQSREIERLWSETGKQFEKALELTRSCRGTIVVVGFGKSGAVGAKLAATMRSAGRRAFLINPVEAFHGEAASISGDDIAILISSSGESDEIMRIIPWLKKKKVKLIALTPYERSNMARASDVVLKTVAPMDTTDNYASYSTCLSALALGDLLALALLYDQDIERERSSSVKAGAGEAIYAIEDLLATRPNNPVVKHDLIFRDALIVLTSKGLGAISVIGEDGKLAGIITDGDVRRILQRSQGSITQLFLKNVDSVMTKNPKRITASKTLFDALNMMEDNAITVLPVVNEDSAPVGMLHLHDLVQLGMLVGSSGRKPAAATAKKRAAKNKRKPK